LVEKMRATGAGHASYADSMETAVEQAVAQARPGDAIITLGAGSIWRAGDDLLAGLEARFANAESERATN
jgi:UDP-N-acetylmuramate-alanine ligase